MTFFGMIHHHDQTTEFQPNRFGRKWKNCSSILDLHMPQSGLISPCSSRYLKLKKSNCLAAI